MKTTVKIKISGKIPGKLFSEIYNSAIDTGEIEYVECDYESEMDGNFITVVIEP